MSLLICKFASQRSRPEKIRRYIAYLEDIQRKHHGDLEARRTIERLLSDARGMIAVQAHVPPAA